MNLGMTSMNTWVAAGSASTRERDRLRPEILTRMGWHLERVWSIDWFKARKATAQRLQDALQSGPKPVDTREPTIAYHLETASLEPACSELITEYTECTSLGLDTTAELVSCTPHVLSRAIQQVVDCEGPIHQEDAIKRVRELWGLRQTGTKIRETLEGAIDHAAADSIIELRGVFLWPLRTTALTVRRRQDIDWEKISDEEIALGATIVLKRQYATPSDELIREVAYLFGLRRVGEESTTRIGSVLNQLETTGKLRKTFADRLEPAV